MPHTNQNDKEKTALSSLKGVSDNMKIVLERQRRLEEMLKSIKSDLDTVAKPFTQHMFVDMYVAGKWEKGSLTEWIKAMQKRIDEVL